MFGSSSMTRIFAAMLPASYPVIHPFGTTYITAAPRFDVLRPSYEQCYGKVSEELAQTRGGAFVRAPLDYVLEVARR